PSTVGPNLSLAALADRLPGISAPFGGTDCQDDGKNLGIGCGSAVNDPGGGCTARRGRRPSGGTPTAGRSPGIGPRPQPTSRRSTAAGRSPRRASRSGTARTALRPTLASRRGPCPLPGPPRQAARGGARRRACPALLAGALDEDAAHGLGRRGE